MRPGDIVARGEQRGGGARNASNREGRRMKRERTKKKRRPEGGKKQYWQKSRGCPSKGGDNVVEKRWLCVECREEAKRDTRWRGIRMKDIVALLFYVQDKG